MIAVYLNQFHVIKPKNCMPQDHLIEWIIKCHQEAEKAGNHTDKMDSELLAKLFNRYGVKATQISQRFCETDDVTTNQFNENTIYKIDEHHSNGVDINERAHFFSERSFEIMKKFYPLSEALRTPDHILHVSCTGYISPSAPQRIVSEEIWKKNTAITHAYHMGCYASLPAIRLAKSLVIAETIEHNSHFQTDIIHNEMCGLHMNALAHTPEQMVVQTLFADGHIKYSASTTKTTEGKNYKILTVMEKIITDSQQDMSWTPASWGMQMNLSREVPGKVKTELKLFANELFSKAGLTASQGLNAVFAIHPGGPKIIDAVKDVLELRENQISESRKILFERGNMSSATLPHVWDEILNQNYPTGTFVVSFAFGPGLTIFGSVFEVC